ncbi:hypothetical protein DCAR_0101395 [Daucus carota subsp. sativus]|uniref:BZIP domain-containing protein n=1 Tax=Daucus carota subsp. sativus TaxID=79200 RepID=A0AAF0W5T2_DAUCS|nr:PREDICTED: uncharacterized protein At4g06598-like [Daucus carota subsp. sativus]XP_017237653.1 PREDICTED: uncharacterized protein At4g06598-like [Daucus carota subsp. sativus]WOG82233.1 hypothetical protein DCAR_0101395 [Daucus carota subsp. sativus]
MEGSNGVSNSSNFSYTNLKQMLHPPISPLLCISPPPSEGKYNVDGQYSHQRCSSESVAIEEQPSWVADLLDEPEMQPKTHRRSASDSSALYFDASTGTSDTMPPNMAVFNPWMSPQNVVHRGDPMLASFNANANGNRGQPSRFSTEALLNHSIFSVGDGMMLQGPGATSGPLADQELSLAAEANGQTESGESSDQSQAKSKAEAKRAKQQSAHRSRVRKLQYIAELERHVQLFQTESLKLAGEYEFLDQQNLILGMENRALRHRLESLSQEQLLRNMEHDMLERELIRLQMLYQVQRQQLQQQSQLYPKHRRSKSRDCGNKSLKNKEAAGSSHVSFGDVESHLASLSLAPKEASS